LPGAIVACACGQCAYAPRVANPPGASREMGDAVMKIVCRGRAVAAQALAILCGIAVVGTAVAETIVVDDQVMVKQSSVEKPKRGSSMNDVQARFGAPVEKHPAVSDPGKPMQPPITRWDYAGFSVFFEHDRVIDAVATGG
jgi:hypothetical protein